ncbi:MAG TPA: hypothetical protein PLD47_00110 [Aggregatilineales bacterium]|nr:hypothetical protein [Anaerolineales bacterium]HRE46101.1 hypothetical protein [Aggregatilineales bacterium]
MPRTTLKDKARKNRIRAHEYNKMRRQLILIEAITPEQIKTLQKVESIMEKGDFPTVAQVPGWEALREMGVIRLVEEKVILTSLGGDVLEAEEA